MLVAGVEGLLAETHWVISPVITHVFGDVLLYSRVGCSKCGCTARTDITKSLIRDVLFRCEQPAAVHQATAQALPRQREKFIERNRETRCAQVKFTGIFRELEHVYLSQGFNLHAKYL